MRPERVVREWALRPSRGRVCGRPGIAWPSGALVLMLLAGASGDGGRLRAETSPRAFVVERDADVTRPAPGPHGGLGRTTGYHFFDDVPGVPFAFRKRALHPGASIGPHRQHEDEVYYVLSGTGRMTIDGQEFEVGPGDGVLTRPGSTHALAQRGDEDLVIIIVYPRGETQDAAPAER